MVMKIVVTSGPFSGKEFLLQREVVRVGSSAGCDVVLELADLPPHAFTLQQTSAGMEVYVRGNAPFMLNRKPLQNGSVWATGGTLSLGNSLSMRLEEHQGYAVQEDRSARQMIEDDDDDDMEVIKKPGATQTEAEEKKSSNATSQAVVILLCMLMGAFLLLRGKGGGEGNAEEQKLKSISFEELNAKLRERGKTDPHFEALHRDLLAAYRYERSGNIEQAKRNYKHMIQLMVDRIPQVDQGVYGAPKLQEGENPGKTVPDYLEDDLERQVYYFALQRQ